ncbi:D-amino peptidase [Thermosporothrix hazakensis]|jgi:D-amino peptidase|uniref:D-amino peptidase n=1 Tax=Thermosporothrix hazakensis TaxID=644383 RepID=A0A326U1J1_THEHA|nr:M55 family metallopeptidase [Thermosporothrix hazakensis]PZW24835.1 D-amino peptidase [Thermosporothrix hazakensis]GCE46475.1 peptide ABC transporter substrate-binding protein [Thermosporothrix hazakensis]
MKLFLSTDFEGTSGVVAWEQILEGKVEYEQGRKLLTAEVNAVIEGALQAGAREFVVNDAHSSMRNLHPQNLKGRATLITGRHKPLYMMEGLDSSFDGVCLVSYHGSIGAEKAILSHTYNPGAIWEVRINGEIVGESGLNALVAAHYGVPIIFVSGDDATAQEAEGIAPKAEKIVVKHSLGRFAAVNLHPEVACELLKEGAERAVKRLGEMEPPHFLLPVTVEITFLVADMADMALWIRGVERVGARTVKVVGEDLLELYRTFVTIVMLTRGLVDR